MKKIIYILCGILLSSTVHGARVLESANTEYFQATTTCSISAYPFSISAWVKIPSGGGGTIFGFTDISTPTSYYQVYATEVSAMVLDRNTNARIATSTTGLSVDTWYNIIAVFKSGTSRYVYLNNGSFDEDTQSSTWNAGEDTTAIGRLSRSSPDGYFNGTISEVGLWDVEITSGNRTSLQTDTPDNVGSVIAYWPLDEVGGGNAIDNEDTGTDYDLTENGTIAYSSDDPFASSSIIPIIQYNRNQQ